MEVLKNVENKNKNKIKVLITGAGGFVGQVLSKLLIEQGYAVRALVRNRYVAFENSDLEQIYFDDKLHVEKSFFENIFKNINVVVHLAAQVHQFQAKTENKKKYDEINVELTSRLAKAAAEASVQQFIYISTIKVNGEKTEPNQPFTIYDVPNPQDDYAKSKYLAELNLKEIFAHSDIAYTIIRPPLVYGPQAVGNFEKLTRLIQNKPFLLSPLGGIKNKRSFIAVHYLAHCIEQAILNPAVYNQLLLVSDEKDISTPELIRYIAYVQKKNIRLFPVPPIILKWLAKCMGAESQYDKLTQNLQIDSQSSIALLNNLIL